MQLEKKSCRMNVSRSNSKLEAVIDFPLKAKFTVSVHHHKLIIKSWIQVTHYR